MKYCIEFAFVYQYYNYLLKYRMKFSKHLFFLLLTATLASCGGSDNSNNESADGVWSGYITHSYGDSIQVYAASIGDKLIVVEDNEAVISATISINGDKITSDNAKIFNYNDIYLMDMNVDGIVNTKANIMATLVDNEGVKSTLSLVYDKSFEQPISYSDMSGAWSFWFDGSEFSYPLTIDESGSYYVEEGGCIVSGKFSIPNNMLSIISFNYTVSGDDDCVDGDYSGLSLVDGDYVMQIATSNQYSIVNELVKIGQ